MENRSDTFVGVPIHKRPGYQAKNFAGGNSQTPAEAAEQWAAMGPGHQQTFEGVDHSRNSIVAQTIHMSEPGHGELGHLSPHQVMSGSGFDIDPKSVTKVDQGSIPGGPFSRGIHPNQDPDNPGPQEPPASLWHETQKGMSVGTGPSVIRNRGNESTPGKGVTPYSSYIGGGNQPDSTGGPVGEWQRPPLNPDEFGG